MIKKQLYLAFVVCAMCACSDSNTEIEMRKKSDFYNLKSISEKKVIYKGFQSYNQQIIGAGYDVTAGYLDFNAVKAPIFDLKKVPEDRLYRMGSNSCNPVNYRGTDVHDFLSDIMHHIQINDIPKKESETATTLFAGTLLNNETFSSEYDHSSQYSFAYCEQVINIERWIINLPVLEDNQFISQEFLYDVKHTTPNEIINKYGTHVLNDICLGLRLRGIYRTMVSSNPYSAAEIAFYNALWEMGKVGFFTGTTVSQDDNKLAQSIGGQLVVEYHGGNALMAASFGQKKYKDWLDSANEDNYALTEILNTLTPIYELIADGTKREQVKAAVYQYIADHEIKMVKTTPLFQSWDGIYHTYYNSYEDAIIGYEGPVCSVYQEEGNQRVPLYCYSNGKNHYLTLQGSEVNLGNDWHLEGIIGYAYNYPVEGSIPLYECKSKNDYCYTIEDKDNYGKKGDWKKIRIVCYVLPL